MFLTIFQKYISKILAEKLNIFVIIYFNNILLYIKNPNKVHMNIVSLGSRLIIEVFFFANCKNGYFYLKNICFLRFILFSKKIQIEKEKIEVVKNWLKFKLTYNI